MLQIIIFVDLLPWTVGVAKKAVHKGPNLAMGMPHQGDTLRECPAYHIQNFATFSNLVSIPKKRNDVMFCGNAKYYGKVHVI